MSMFANVTEFLSGPCGYPVAQYDGTDLLEYVEYGTVILDGVAVELAFIDNDHGDKFYGLVVFRAVSTDGSIPTVELFKPDYFDTVTYRAPSRAAAQSVMGALFKL